MVQNTLKPYFLCYINYRLINMNNEICIILKVVNKQITLWSKALGCHFNV